VIWREDEKSQKRELEGKNIKQEGEERGRVCVRKITCTARSPHLLLRWRLDLMQVSWTGLFLEWRGEEFRRGEEVKR
jgi:hypothetical protein